MHVVEANPSQGDFNGRGALKFNTVSMAPIQTKMIIIELMTKNEVTWFLIVFQFRNDTYIQQKITGDMAQRLS